MSAIITATGTTITLDESAGLQNLTATPVPAGDANDNDIDNSALPADFSTRLTQLGLAAPTIGSALGGYTGAAGNTGSNMLNVTFDPGSVSTDLSFVGPGGVPLNGLDSGIDTLNNSNILLYTDTNNNIVLGREEGSNAIIFALYLQETGATGGTPPTGAKIWSVQYAPLKNTDPSKPDEGDSLSLLNKVFVAASQDLSFSLANAPSGQNLFMMFTTANPSIDGTGRITSPAIIATGKDPANQSTGVNITTGDTINSSQGGGTTTFGTNNQMIVEGEGLRFSFVTGANSNYTIPNLSETEADIEKNVDFTNMFNAKAATFDVVQLQSGKSAVVKISASNTAAEPGVNFIDGYGNDSSVAITHIKVTKSGTVLIDTSSSATANGVTVNFSGGVATISGVTAGAHIEYSTTTDHNRVLIENAGSGKGNASADFDIGGFKLLQGTTVATEIGSKITFEDDGPSISTTGALPTLTVDETFLTTDDTKNFAGNFTSAFGADGAGTLTYALGISAAGADSGLVDTESGNHVFLFLNGGVVESREGTDSGTAAAGPVVFTVSAAANGDVTLDQQRAVVHTPDSGPDQSTGLSAATLITLTGTITDKDGDSQNAVLNIGDKLVFKDDGPTDFSPASVTLTNNGSAIATGDLDTTSTASPWLPARVGADQPGIVKFVDNNPADDYLRSTAIGTPILKSGGENIVLSGFGTGTLLAQTETTHLTVFTATLDSVGGQYKIDFDKAIDDGSGVTILGAAPVKSGNPDYNLIDNVGGTALDILFSGTVPGTDTVNVSTQGAGVGNQTMNAGETLRLDLVNGGALAGNPLGSDFNYTAHQTVNGFSFLVSQNSPGGTEGTVYLKAYDADNDKTLSGDVGDTVDPITKVTVNGQLLVDGATFHTLTINGHRDPYSFR